MGEVWDKPPAAGLVGPARSDGAQHALKMRSGPGEGPGGQPRFAELVLSRFVDDFIPAPGDEAVTHAGGDSPVGGRAVGRRDKRGRRRTGRDDYAASRVCRAPGRADGAGGESRVDGWAAARERTSDTNGPPGVRRIGYSGVQSSKLIFSTSS